MTTATAVGNERPQLLAALRAVRKGDFSVRLPAEENGSEGSVAEVFNEIVELLENTTDEFERIGDVVGKQGRIGQRASLPGATGAWARWIDSINTLVSDTVQPTAEVARVIGAVAKGDLSQRVPMEID